MCSWTREKEHTIHTAPHEIYLIRNFNDFFYTHECCVLFVRYSWNDALKLPKYVWFYNYLQTRFHFMDESIMWHFGLSYKFVTRRIPVEKNFDSFTGSRKNKRRWKQVKELKPLAYQVRNCYANVKAFNNKVFRFFV